MKGSKAGVLIALGLPSAPLVARPLPEQARPTLGQPGSILPPPGAKKAGLRRYDMAGKGLALGAGVLVALFSSGCFSAGLVAMVGIDPREADFAPGTPRAEVEAKLGGPISSEAGPGGARIDTYEFRIKQRVSDQLVVQDILSFGTIGAASAPFWLAMWPHWQSSITYGPDDRVVSLKVWPGNWDPEAERKMKIRADTLHAQEPAIRGTCEEQARAMRRAGSANTLTELSAAWVYDEGGHQFPLEEIVRRCVAARLTIFDPPEPATR